jgi:hypothetical protein
MKLFKSVLITLIAFGIVLIACSDKQVDRYKFNDDLVASLKKDDVLVRISVDGKTELIDSDGKVGDECTFPPRTAKGSSTNDSASKKDCHGLSEGAEINQITDVTILYSSNKSWKNSHTCWYCYTDVSDPNVPREICYPRGCKREGHW